MLKIILLVSISFSAFGQVNYEQFVTLKKSLHQAFLELRPSGLDKLVINKEIPNLELFWWKSDSVHASYSRTVLEGITNHNIFIFGGFARQNKMTIDGLALTACHEIGHGIGGAPFKISGSSTEGQADYFATNICLPVVFKYLKSTNPNTKNSYVKDLCSRASRSPKKCMRFITAIESDIAFFETLGEYTRFSSYSFEQAINLNLTDRFYPDAQCRVDTMVHGALKLERPRCWYPGGIDRRL